jgi:ribosome biogenesis GTPase / thiamine phosphate phosphatase
MTVDLSAYGWGERFADAFAPHEAAGLQPARVTLEHTHVYRAVTAAGERLARVAGRLRHQAASRAEFPAVGDWVAIDPPQHGADARIRAVLPRVSRFSRRAAGDPTEEQVLAANIDTVFLVAGLDHDFNLRRLERYLLVAWESGASPVILLNKADLAADADARLSDVRTMAPTVPVYAVTCLAPETLHPVGLHLGRGRTGALLGSSGVGKSTIVNRLIGRDRLPTQDVRASDSRGRHTSTNRQLVLIPDVGLIIDTPGLREIQLWETGGWTETFPDIAALAEQCRFRDCRHRQEPGCAVVAAVDAGALSANRHESYLKLAAEQEHVERQQDVRAQLDQKRQGRIGAKALRKHLKEKRQP